MDALVTRPPAGSRSAALRELLGRLRDLDYAFVTPTPSTHALVRDRRTARRETALRDVFGWSRPFTPDLLTPDLLDLLERADVARSTGEGLRLDIRVSSLDGRLFLHSAPGPDRDAVFLGPDSYRFARFLRQVLPGGAATGVALDIGVGAGVGAATVATACPGARVMASDVNPRALEFARINLAQAALAVELVEASGLPAGPERFDLIVANPPYIAGEDGRTYRDGGGQLGAALALDWVRDGVGRLSPGGRFVLYTGSAIVDGRDAVRAAVTELAEARGLALDYEEIDPDVFGGTLRNDAYRDVERIAAVGAVLTAP